MALKPLARSLAATLITLMMAGCSLRGGTPKPTVTPNDYLVIVTATTSTGTSTRATATTGQTTYYVVQEGDSLLEIAVRFDLTLAELATANGISDPNSITAGQRLVIPPPSR